jgi:hypothetical protein
MEVHTVLYCIRQLEFCCLQVSSIESYPMRLKARGLAQLDGLPGWLEESDPAV